ncbi:MAG: CaiB/BaiF CoA-transferase family protein [Smithella sp.]|jgi:crotonobetainyl-CoA:carnitine CoA-transferase CaiB-like acyl-CoA transferase
MQILEKIRVLDLSQFLSGPRASQLLAFFGAEVIKIEPPTGDSMRMLLQVSGSERSMSCLHQNKKGIVIDLKKKEGVDLFLQLVEQSDVIIENLKPGTLDAGGLGYETMKKRNPRLIYAKISGFGNEGPLADRTAFDIISQATAGIMYANGTVDRPPGVFFGDLTSGAYCAFGIMLALMAREKTGEGQFIDISMQDVMYFHNFWCFTEKANGPVKENIKQLFGREMKKFLSDYEHPMPFWSTYKCSDGYICVVALTDNQWNNLLEVIGRKDLITDARFMNFIDRVKNADDARAIINRWMEQYTCDAIIDKLNSRRIPCGKVVDNDEANDDENLRSRGMFAKVSHKIMGDIDVPGNPVNLSGTPGFISSPSPDLGEHTEEILQKVLNISPDSLKILKTDGVIR